MSLKKRIILPTDGVWGVFEGRTDGKRGFVRIEVEEKGTLIASMPRTAQNIANAYIMAQAKKMHSELLTLLPILEAAEQTPDIVAHIEEIKGILIESEYRVIESERR